MAGRSRTTGSAVVGDTARARILAGAEERFLNFGFTAVTMGDLAGELGMSKKTIYLFIASKQDLLNAVLDQRLSRIAARMTQIMEDQETSFPAKLERLLTFLTEALSEVKPPFLRDLKLHAPASFERIESVRQKLIPLHFGRLVAEGKRHGMIRPDLQDKVLIELMCGLAQSVINPEVVTRLGVSLREAFETVFQTVFVGIMTAQGRRVYEESQKIMGH